MGAPKGNQYAKGCTTSGRPTKFTKSALRIAKKMYELGAIDTEVAEALEIDIATLYRWAVDHKEFCEVRKLAKEPANDRVEMSLYHRAMGYSHAAEEIKVIEGQIQRVPTVKHYPPDTTAAIFFLKNRRPKDWQDRQQHDVKLGFNEFLESLEGEDD